MGGEDFDDIEQMVAKLGPERAAAAWRNDPGFDDDIMFNDDDLGIEEKEEEELTKDHVVESDMESVSSASSDDDDDDGIFYVGEKHLENVRQKLKKGEEITQELVNQLAFPEDLPDEEVVVPVDMGC